MRLAHPPRDQLRVLRAEVDDEDEVIGDSRLGRERERELVALGVGDRRDRDAFLGPVLGRLHDGSSGGGDGCARGVEIVDVETETDLTCRACIATVVQSDPDACGDRERRPVRRRELHFGAERVAGSTRSAGPCRRP